MNKGLVFLLEIKTKYEVHWCRMKQTGIFPLCYANCGGNLLTAGIARSNLSLFFSIVRATLGIL